jgi:hypothetical protein
LVSHLSFETGWNVPSVNLMIRSHWIGSWSDPPVFCRLPGRRNWFASLQLRKAFMSAARVGFFPAL